MISLQLLSPKIPQRHEQQVRAFVRTLPRLAAALWDFPWRRKVRQLPPELSFAIQLVSDAQMTELNARYRGKRSTTDVLSFSYIEKNIPAFTHEIAGEIYIALPQAARQAKSEGHPLSHELLVLLIHGVLHLLGYDHEKSKSEENRMRQAEEKLFATLALSKNSARVLTAR